MKLLKRIKASIFNGHYGHPTGIVGYVLGEKMVRQHVPETAWTLSLLDIKQDDRILELGFGAGRAIELATAQASNGRIAGIDISQAMVHAASRRNAQSIKKGRVALCQGDVTALPFTDNQFDKVFSIQTFYFWSDAPRTLTEIFRVLKPGAMLVVTLSTGTIGTTEKTGLESYQQTLEEQVIPDMKRLGFATAYIKQGPASRQFKTTAFIGVK